jgi:nucleoside-diphosphate-sugar epimerase
MTASDKRILVTGASGFIGRALVAHWKSTGIFIRAAVRRPTTSTAANETVLTGNIDRHTDWKAATVGITTIIHLAARAHALGEASANALPKFRAVNVEGVEHLAHAAATTGVRRVVLLSSVKVNGEHTGLHPFIESDMPQPEDAYGISKWEAEQALARVAKETGMEFVVLRAPLVYGPGVKGNFLHLMRWIARGTPLPFASVANRRSLIYVGNLVDAITACIEAPAAAGKTYLVGDREDVSTPHLIRALAAALGVQARLFPCPAALLRLGAGMLDKSAEIARLTGSLQVDSARIRNELGWRPRFTLPEGLEQTARWYRRVNQVSE